MGEDPFGQRMTTLVCDLIAGHMAFSVGVGRRRASSRVSVRVERRRASDRALFFVLFFVGAGEFEA